MVRKTVTIKDDLFQTFESNHIIKQKKEQYKIAMIEASKDKLYLEDIKSIEDKFQYSDYENMK